MELIADIRADACRPATTSDLASDVAVGLDSRPKSLPSRWFYDGQGSALYQEITQLPEYYLTRCEREILLRRSGQIAAELAGRPLRLWEFGAGDGAKTEILLAELLRRGLDVEYVPIDICAEVLAGLAARLRRTFSGAPLMVSPAVGEYGEAWSRFCSSFEARNAVLFLGSSIGNMHLGEAAKFLAAVRRRLQPGDGLLVGFDLKKDPAILCRAYDDPAGVTRQFNLNLLDRLNRELGATFDRNRFRHHCTYNARKGRMESWLLSSEPQEVSVAALDRSYAFDAWEGIQVEYSYKYDLGQIEALARAARFRQRRQFFDAQRYFVDCWWRV